jgi:hypothetical protein
MEFMKKNGIQITGSFSFGSMLAIFIRDPDRNVIGLDAYNDVEGKDSKEYAPP